MVTFFRSSRVWAVEYQYQGRTRHWLKALPEGSDAQQAIAQELQDLYGAHARVVSVRPATDQEERAYARGEGPRNAFCPTGKLPLSPVRPPPGETDEPA